MTAGGRRLLCGIRPEWRVVLRSLAPAADRRSMPRRLELTSGQILRVDLPPPD